MGKEIHDPISRYTVTLEGHEDRLVVECRVKPGGGVPMHLHPQQEERFFVREGQVTFKVAGRTQIAGPGSELTVPAGTKHLFKNTTSDDACFRAELSPPLQAEGFFEATAAAAQAGLLSRRGLPRSLRAARELTEILDRYREVMVLSFPPPLMQRGLSALLRRLPG